MFWTKLNSRLIKFHCSNVSTHAFIHGKGDVLYTRVSVSFVWGAAYAGYLFCCDGASPNRKMHGKSELTYKTPNPFCDDRIHL